MSVLILMHASYEGPGLIETFLREHCTPYTIVGSFIEKIPDPGSFDTLVLMGGPMSVNDAASLPYLKEEIELAGTFIRKGKKVFGVCLGAQIIASALGARVYKGPQPEIGWIDIELLPDGRTDQGMKALFGSSSANGPDRLIKVFHWHGETFDIPEGAVHLASSMMYRNQAFRFGQKTYAFQFHIELDSGLMRAWKPMLPESADINSDEARLPEYTGRAMNFFRKFFIEK